MPNPVTIENIEAMRRREGIDDVALRRAIYDLRVGDFVKLTLLTAAETPAAETLLVRITRINTVGFRGKLVTKPALAGLANLEAGSIVTFNKAQIHSLVKAAR
jgi:hypothetical protein